MVTSTAAVVCSTALFERLAFGLPTLVALAGRPGPRLATGRDAGAGSNRR